METEINADMSAIFDNYQRKSGGGSGGGRKTVIDADMFARIVDTAKAQITAQNGKPVFVSVQTLDKLLKMSVKRANSIVKNVKSNVELETVLKDNDISIGTYGVSIAKGKHGVSFSLGYIGKL